MQALSYADLLSSISSLREKLNALGIGRGDRVAIVGRSDSEMAVLIAGILDTATAVPLNPAYSESEFIEHLTDLRVSSVAIDGEMDTPARAAAEKIGLPVIEVDRADGPVAGIIDIRFDGQIRDKPLQSGPAQPDDQALVLLTSGTTSHSKIVPFTHRQYLAKIERIARAFQLVPDDCCLNLMPLFHGHGLDQALGASLYSGSSLVMFPDFSVDRFFQLFEVLSPTWYTGSYTFHHSICAAARNHLAEVSKSNLRFIKTSSGHLEPRIADELETIFHAPVIETYTCTEAGRISGTPFPPADPRRGTAGIPFGCDVSIMGSDNELLGPGERGEVVVRTTETFTGYENDPAANAHAFVDGWFRTGDEGMFDEDGYLTLTGRIKDIINRGGEKITPSEVDDALASHPDVAAAVSFPVPHASLGQEVAAAVVPHKGAALTDEILANFLRGKLARFKIPRKFLIVDEIPKGPTGKIQRRRLAEAFGLEMGVATSREPETRDVPATALEKKLVQMWAEVLSLEHVGFDEDFFLLGGDSLQAVDLFLRIEKELGTRLPRSVLFEAGTVAKMARVIEESGGSPCLVHLQPNGNAPPFFCIHDGNGEVLNYRELARLVGEGQPFIGIRCRGLDGEDEPFTRIDDMAAFYVHEIKKVQPVGPYYLGGYSFGGRVAYVMAQHLKAAGEEVALVALIDTYSHYGQRNVEMRDWFAHHIDRLKGLNPSRILSYLWLRLTNLAFMIYMDLRRVTYSLAWRLFKSLGRPLPYFLRRPVPANDMIRSAYQPQPYDGDVVLFKAERYAWTHANAHDGWNDLVLGNLEIRKIPGQHFEIVKQPYVQSLAAELSQALKQAQDRNRESGGTSGASPSDTSGRRGTRSDERQLSNALTRSSESGETAAFTFRVQPK